MGMWPLYRESLLQGPSHVSLAIPGVPSNISKSVGGTQPALLLIPNIEFLTAFTEGNIGIGDSVLKGSLLASANSFTANIPTSLPKPPSLPSASVPNIQVPNVPAVPALPAKPALPNATTIPNGANVPNGVNVPNVPNINVPNVPTANLPNIPDVPQIPKVPNINEMALKRFLEANQIDLPDLEKYKVNGKIKIPAADIQLPSYLDSVGLKAMEKTTLLSIFETQKPYMEIAKVILSSMVKIEDIVARIMPVLSINPLTSKSEKPIVKDGSKNGTKAVGYKNGEDIKKILAQLDKISKKGGEVIVNKDGSVTKKKPAKKPTTTDNPNLSDAEANKLGKVWKIISTVYSTGKFDPSVNYLYSYNILPPDDEVANNLAVDNTANEPDDPYDKYKPKKILLGIFKSDGTPLNPNETLKTIGLNGILPEKVDTTFKKAEWALKSPKWVFRNNDYIWPSFGGSSGQPIYLWEGPLGITQESKTSPGNNWSIKKYKEGDKNQLNKVDAVPGDPIIVKFDSTDSGEYTKYFTDFTKAKTNMSKDLDQNEKAAIVSDIISKLDVQSHLQNVFLYGSAKNSYYKDPGFPDAMKKSFKPYQIYVAESVNDPSLPGDGLIWVDPEADYDFKIIRIDPVSKIEYQKAKGEPNISAEIKSFVKNKVIFKLQNNTKFNIVIDKNGTKEVDLKGITEYTLENWNYENGKIVPNFFNVKITTESGKVIIDKLYTALDLPDFGKQQELTISLAGDIKSADSNIPLYGVKVTTSDNKGGVVIDPSKIKNDFLSTEDLFSKGFYGNGTKDNPQQIEVIKRYALTDLDTESYYVIEGIKVGENSGVDAKGEDGSKWYRLPHAFGAMIPFLKFLIDLATKLFPNIAKLLKLFSNPMSFITDIISEKVGEAFAIFSPEAFKKFEDAKKIMDKKKDIIDNGRTSDYSQQLRKHFNMSPLVNHVHVDEFSYSNPGKFKFMLDGVAMIPFEIFGKSIPFGMELKMANLIPEVPNINVPKVDIQAPKIEVPKVPEVPKVDTSTIKSGNIPSAPTIQAPTLPTKPNISVPNVGIPSITLPKVESPIKLIMGKIGKAKTKDCDSSNQTPPTTGKTNNDYLNALNNPTKDKNENNKNKKTNLNDWTIVSTWYSTGKFIKGVDYNYIYVYEDSLALIKEVDDLIYPSGSSDADSLPGGPNANNSDNTPVPVEDLLLAKEKISDALKKDPTNALFKLKLKEINKKLLDSAKLTQPILKLALGMVATPIKVVACIVQWILDFFKSLINPMMLPAKIIEFLSFKWIMKFFSPQGLLKTAGIDFNPSIVQEWVSLAKIPNVSVPDVSLPNVTAPNVTVPNINAPNVNVPKVEVPKIPKVDLGFNISSNPSDILKNIPKHNGKYALPDNFQIADLTKFLNVSFMATLPTYDAKTIRENPKLPFMVFDPVLCFIEKLINGFIDFIWSTLGIEAIIKPPHIKLCKSKTPEEVNKLQNGEAPKSPSDTAPDATQIDSTIPYQDMKAADAFVYEVQLPDGKIVTLKNDEELQNFIDQNKNLGFDLQF
jgi:hypothetical protein